MGKSVAFVPQTTSKGSGHGNMLSNNSKIVLDEIEEGWCVVHNNEPGRRPETMGISHPNEDTWEDVEDCMGNTSPLHISDDEDEPSTTESTNQIEEKPCSKEAQLLEQRLLAVLLGAEQQQVKTMTNKKKRGKKGKGGTRKCRR